MLAVIYLIFNEGYVAGSGDDLTRAELCVEAVRLGRVLAELMPADQAYGSVSTVPGPTELTRMPRRPNSWAMPSVIWLIAAFEAAYHTNSPGEPYFEAAEATLTMTPPAPPRLRVFELGRSTRWDRSPSFRVRRRRS